jgi:hypothetical protein
VEGVEDLVSRHARIVATCWSPGKGDARRNLFVIAEPEA